MLKPTSLLYIRHILKMSTSNLPRFILSIVGLAAGLFIFASGNIFIDSYFANSLKDIEQMEDQSILVSTQTEDERCIQELKDLQSKEPLRMALRESDTRLCIKEYTNEKKLSLSARVCGISVTSDNVLPVYYQDSTYIGKKANLIRGRMFHSSDLAANSKIIIIDELTEQILFGQNAIGKHIVFNGGQDGLSTVSTDKDDSTQTSEEKIYTVVGVIQNPYSSDVQSLSYRKFLEKPTKDVTLNTTVYCPISTVEKEGDLSPIQTLLWQMDNTKEMKQFEQILNKYNTLNAYKLNSFDLITKAGLIQDMHDLLKPIRILLILMLIVLLSISGINSMSTMFFSIKERINEIGIKKAMGALKSDILLQFIFEGMFLSLISALIAVIFSLITALIAQFYLQNKLFYLFSMQFSLKNILLPIFVAEIYGFIFSFIPSYYGANILVTKALRFE